VPPPPGDITQWMMVASSTMISLLSIPKEPLVFVTEMVIDGGKLLKACSTHVPAPLYAGLHTSSPSSIPQVLSLLNTR